MRFPIRELASKFLQVQSCLDAFQGLASPNHFCDLGNYIRHKRDQSYQFCTGLVASDNWCMTQHHLIKVELGDLLECLWPLRRKGVRCVGNVRTKEQVTTNQQSLFWEKQDDVACSVAWTEIMEADVGRTIQPQAPIERERWQGNVDTPKFLKLSAVRFELAL